MECFINGHIAHFSESNCKPLNFVRWSKDVSSLRLDCYTQEVQPAEWTYYK